MPLYRFDLRDGEALVRDDEAMEWPDVGRAQMEAAQSLADMVRDIRASRPSGHMGLRFGMLKDFFFHCDSHS